MKYTKLMMAGLTAALTLSGAAGVFAEESTGTETQQSTVVQEKESSVSGSEGFRQRPGMEEMIDMSGLELPEDFVPFDEKHVPDGKQAPERGELKPIEFDDEGNMIYGQKPEGMPPIADGGRPELPDGEMPDFADGGRPELPDGEIPDFADGGRPELPDGEMPDFADSGRPEFPDGEMPDFADGGRPELPDGEMPDFADSERPELPDGGYPQFMNGQMPQMGGQAPQRINGSFSENSQESRIS